MSQNVDLKNLLSDWKLESILAHLLEEKIDVDILGMMKLSHIKLLLHNFPLGLQIRFEYYLELWRKEMGKPFPITTIEERLHIPSNELYANTKSISKRTENKATQTDLIIFNVAALENANTENHINATNSIPCDDDQTTLEPTSGHIPAALSSGKNVKTVLPEHQVDLLTILKNATCGIGLITNYGQRQTFTNSERKLLIETIVAYYMKNKMEFNVQTSYALERAILKMFPSEKLSFYRTNEHGHLYMRYISLKSAESGSRMDHNAAESEEIKELYQYLGEHTTIEASNTADSVMTDISDIDDEHEKGTSMSDSVDSTAKIKFLIADNNENVENKIQLQTNSRVFDTTSLDSAVLISKMLSKRRKLIEDVDRPFINFSIPWHKVPLDVITSLENGQTLGKRLNTLANLIVDEIRKISTHVPMRVLRAVSQQAITKYPHSFLEKDCHGNVKSSTTTPLLTRLRNRNTFLNRQT